MRGAASVASFAAAALVFQRELAPQQAARIVGYPLQPGFGGHTLLALLRGFAALRSRLGLLAGTERSVAVWTDTRGGTVQTNKQDLALATVAVSSPSRLRLPTWFAGFVLVAGGLLALAVAVLSGLRSEA